MSRCIVDGMPDPNAPRKRWMAVLARASDAAIAERLDACGTFPAFEGVRGPEQGLVMARGRTGGGGAPFNLGEVTVTRCTVRSANGLIGHAYVTGRNGRHAELAAWVDALMQDPARTETVEQIVITPLEAAEHARRAATAAKAEATKVHFFAMQNMRT